MHHVEGGGAGGAVTQDIRHHRLVHLRGVETSDQEQHVLTHLPPSLVPGVVNSLLSALNLKYEFKDQLQKVLSHVDKDKRISGL